KQDLEEILGNLMDNGCKWADARVSLSTDVATTDVAGTGKPEAGRSERADQFQLRIDDDGPGLTDDEMHKIVGRGVRLDESKPGSGLGLSIVSDLAQLYQGRFELAVSPTGGLRAIVTLPRA
ncbi:MAG: ATP-binding protein, partial [Pseudomonadota bacterium]